jgi:hypothetical protein
LGADALGFIFARKPQKVDPETARLIIAQLPPFVASVGVFVDEAATVVQELAVNVGLDWVQLHGQESPDYCRNLGRRVIKAFRIQDEGSLGWPYQARSGPAPGHCRAGRRHRGILTGTGGRRIGGPILLAGACLTTWRAIESLTRLWAPRHRSRGVKIGQAAGVFEAVSS